MDKHMPLVCSFILLASAAFAGVNVSAPTKGSTVGSPVHFAATASSTSCSKGVASMGVYTAPGVLAYVENGTSLNTDLSLSPGTYDTTIEQWDYCGGAATAAVTITVESKSGVFLTAPSSNSKVTSPVDFKATATTTCSKGIAAMGIYTAPNQKAYVVDGASLNTSLSLSDGTYNTVVEEWDKCGGATSTPVRITVAGSGSGGSGGSGKTISQIQSSGGWHGYGELPPNYKICSSCGSGITWSMQQQVNSPSLSGKAAKFNIGGDHAYSDVLWNNHLIGDLSSQGLPDSGHKIVPSVHKLTYDADFYGSDLALSENIEFDIGQFFDGIGMMFGTECQIVNGQKWAIWDNVKGKWISTNAACKPESKKWNHVTIEFERTSSNQLFYKSITLNGAKTDINATYSPFSAPGWYGIVVNFQLDGNYKQSPYSVYVDNLSVTYQ